MICVGSILFRSCWGFGLSAGRARRFRGYIIRYGRVEGVISPRGRRGLCRFFKDKFPGEQKFYDLVPGLAEKKHLKPIYNCHKCAGTLDGGDIDGGGELTVLDIDHIIA